MFCLFYIPRVRMGCWFELKREKVFLDHILANYLNSYSFTERRKNITFYLKRRSVPSRNFKRTKNVKFCFGLFAKQYFSRYWAEFKRRIVNFWCFGQSFLNLLRPCYWKENIWKLLFFLNDVQFHKCQILFWRSFCHPRSLK